MDAMGCQWPEAARKRLRDDEIEGDGTATGQLGFTEHRNKRLHCTAMRLAPTRHWAESSSTPFANENIGASSHPDYGLLMHANEASATPQMDLDQDTEMAIDDVNSPDVPQFNQETANGTGRIPTPIHCSFAAQVRGNHWGAMPSMPSTDDGGYTGMFANDNDAAAAATAAASDQLHQDPSVPRSVNGVTEWSMVQNRRLPSPISENGGEEAAASPEMVLDNGVAGHGHFHSLHERQTAQAMLLHPNIRLSPQPTDAEGTTMDTVDGASPSSAPATPSPRGKFGHIRSKHTINTWTLQPGMKKSFSIGYRADCEKCRMKIPGHFNHIIIS